MQNRKTEVCSRLLNWLYCLASVACAVLGPRVLHAHQAPDRTLDAIQRASRKLHSASKRSPSIGSRSTELTPFSAM